MVFFNLRRGVSHALYIAVFCVSLIVSVPIATADPSFSYLSLEYRESEANGADGDGYGLQAGWEFAPWGQTGVKPLIFADLSDRDFVSGSAELSFAFTGLGVGAALPLGKEARTSVFALLSYEELDARLTLPNQPNPTPAPGPFPPFQPTPTPTPPPGGPTPTPTPSPTPPPSEQGCNSGTPLDPALDIVDALIPICDILFPGDSTGAKNFSAKSAAAGTESGYGYLVGIRHQFQSGWETGLVYRGREIEDFSESSIRASVGYQWGNWGVTADYEQYDELDIEEIILSLRYVWDDLPERASQPRADNTREPATNSKFAPLTTLDYLAIGYASGSGNTPSRVNTVYSGRFSRLPGLFWRLKGDLLNSANTETSREFYTSDVGAEVGYALPLMNLFDVYATGGYHVFEPEGVGQSDAGTRLGLGAAMRLTQNIELMAERIEISSDIIPSRTEFAARWRITPQDSGGYSVGAYIQDLEGQDALTGLRIQLDL